MGLFDSLRTASQGNFGIISANFMQTYVYLRKTYRHRFRSEADILTVASAINARSYVLKGALDVSELEQFHERCTEAAINREYIVQYASWHLATLLRIDTPVVPLEFILDAVFDKKRQVVEEHVDRKLRDAQGGIADSPWNRAVDVAITQEHDMLHILISGYLR